MVAPHASALSDPPELAQAKAALRHRLRAVRAHPPAAHATGALCRRMAGWVRSYLRPGALVAATWPLPGEIDLRGLCADLHADGYGVLLPETLPRGHALRFRRWHPGTPMHPGRFGTHYPDGPVARPDFVFVPLLGFDRRGFRLGYGGGYYDRTLAELGVGTWDGSGAEPAGPREAVSRGAVPAAGYGLAAQEVPAVPVGPHDIPLPVIVTEHETIRCGR